MKWQYVKTDAKTNSEGTVIEESCSNKCCVCYEKSTGLNGFIAILESQCFIINDKFYYIAEIITTLKQLTLEWK